MNGSINLKALLVVSVFLLGLWLEVAAGGTIYVDAAAGGSNDGSNWANAYNYLQDVLAAAGL